MVSRGNLGIIFWEVILLLSSILVFRGVWLLLDRIQWANGTEGLCLLLSVGLVSTCAALRMIHKGK